MKKAFNVFAGIALAAMIVGPAAAAEKDIIEYRINLMKTLGEQAAAIGKIMQNKVAYGDNLAIHAETIAINIRAARKAFEEKAVGGTAKADIWDNWKDFDGRFAGLEKTAMEVAELAKSGGPAAAGPKVGEMFVCKACHDTYRTPKE